MKKHLFNILIISALFNVVAGLSSCEEQNEIPDVDSRRFKIRAELSSSAFSRAVLREDDGFSVAAFSNGEQSGFFSDGGDRNNSNEAFENAPMTYQGGYFVGDENMAVDINRLGHTLLYYPYSDSEFGRQPIRNDNGEVKDLLISLTVGSPDSDNALVARFDHMFSMFVIEGGYGFKNFWQDDVSITLEKPVETVEFHRTSDGVGYYVLFNGAHMDGGTEPSPEYAEVIGHFDSERNKYYIIIPNDGVTKVKSINVKDDGGRVHHIKWNKGNLEFGMRYPLTLELDELVPTIYLHDIVKWDAPIDLEANKAKGIDNAGDFKDWILEYNKEMPDESKLLEYGDRMQVTDELGNPTGEKYWHFYLTGNIDLGDDVIDSNVEHLIGNLTDIFDGCGYTISGLSIKGKSNAALIKTISGSRGCVMNLVLDNLIVEAASSEPVGALVTELQGGTIKDCTVTNLTMHARSAVGVLAGKITGENVSIVNCSFSGVIFGSSTASKILGEGTVSDEIQKNCDTSNVMFGDIGSL